VERSDTAGRIYEKGGWETIERWDSVRVLVLLVVGR